MILFVYSIHSLVLGIMCEEVLVIEFKVNGYTFRGSNSSAYIFASLLNGIKSLGKEFAPVRANSLVEAHFGRVLLSRKRNSHKNCLPLKNGGLFMAVYP